MTEPTKLSIRRAGSDDLGQLANMRWDMRVVEGGEPAELNRAEFISAYCGWLNERLTDARVLHLVAQRGAEILGTIALIPIEMLPRPGRFADRMGYVTNFYVRPTARKSGVGGMLLKAAQKLGSEMDLELLVTWPSEDATSIYQRYGFRDQNDIFELTLRTYS